METTFITIHDLSAEARILYSSDSVVDILGHTPDEIVNKPCWDFFHPNDIDDARELHGRGVKLDKAAVLVYCLLKRRDGRWINCECCFTCVYNVMVVCTSIYSPGVASSKRAAEAPIIRRLFTSSPEDPRYHMLSHLSTKFKRPIDIESHEPRAALFLNRFTRTLTIMYATSGIEQIIGIGSEDMKGRSFYFCIAEQCLEDAVKCLETAKGNDSIAYLRFWFRDPRQDDSVASDDSAAEEDATMTDADMTETEADAEDEDGGVRLDGRDPSQPHELDLDGPSTAASREGTQHGPDAGDANVDTASREPPPLRSLGSNDTSASAQSLNPRLTAAAIFGSPSGSTDRSHRSSVATSPPSVSSRDHPIELEAVVSCTSDGLVVIIRRARPLLPGSVPDAMRTGQTIAAMERPPLYQYPRGIFAAPWAREPMFIPDQPRPVDPGWYHGMQPANAQPLEHVGGPSPQDFMKSIRDVAVFAWAIVGINANLVNYSRGKAEGEAQPPAGFPVWNTGGYTEHHDERAIDSGNVTQTGTGATTSPDPHHTGAG